MLRTSPSASSSSARLLSRDSLLCVVLFTLCALASWPVANIGINDDWSYILTTQAFIHTHHFVYNGWSAPMLGWQALWGSAFARPFGSGFTAIRLSIIPIGAACAILYYAILRNFSLNRAHALFGTLALVLNPLFLSLSDTFMTDVPSLFCILLCIYLCQRALSASNDARVLLWLGAAALTNILGGTARQIAWLGVLVIVPSCGWLLRRRRYVVPFTVIAWIIGAVSIKLITAWYLRHPYSIPESLFPEPLTAASILHLFKMFSRVITVTLLLLLPVLIAGAAAAWPPTTAQLIRAAALVAIVVAVYVISKRLGNPDLLDSFWIGNIITPWGIMQAPDLFASGHPIPNRWMTVILAMIFLCALTFLESLVRRSSGSDPHQEPRHSWHAMNVLLLPFLLCYVLLLCPRAAFVVLFDRYLLAIIAVLMVYLLRWHQERVSPRIPYIASASLALIALLSIAAIHDLFSMARAEVRLTGELHSAGVPRTAIHGGFDFDSVTEVKTDGYLNDPHLINPPGAYHPHLNTPDLQGPCGHLYLYLRYTPSLRVRYVISPELPPCLAPSAFPPQTYRTWLPPRRRQLFIGTPVP